MEYTAVEEMKSERSLRPVVVTVVAAKLLVASLLVAQATVLPPSPVSAAYGLNQ